MRTRLGLWQAETAAGRDAAALYSKAESAMMDVANDIKTRLDAVCVLRGLLGDPVIARLSRYLEAPSVSAYAEFVSALFDANGGNLSLHVKRLCETSDNAYARMAGEGKAVPDCMRASLCEDLKVMQEVSDLTSEELKGMLEYSGSLPDFDNSECRLLHDCLHRMDNIQRYGYGVYAGNPMLCIDESGNVVPVAYPDKTTIFDLVDYKRERGIVIENTRALIEGKPAANVLLAGDAGTGKSSTVKAVGNMFFEDGLRIVEVRKDQLHHILPLLNELSRNPLKFVLFIDDLSFLRDDGNFNVLKAVLEGSVHAKSSNVVIYATSNRRHIVKETFSDREGDDIHRNDTMQELLSLSARFGICVTFSKPNRESYLRIVRRLAQKEGVALPVAELEAGAERLALSRGGRSPRLARQYIDGLLSG